MLHSTCANELLYYISAATPSTARPRITVRRRRAAPGTPPDRGPWEDVALPRNAIDAAFLVVPWPAPSLSTASQPPLVPQLYGKSRTVVLSRAIDLSQFRAAPAGRPCRSIVPSGMQRLQLAGLVRDAAYSTEAACSWQRIARRRVPRCPSRASRGGLLPRWACCSAAKLYCGTRRHAAADRR